MKRLALATSLAAVLIACSAALAAGTLSGTYKRTLHTTALRGAVNGTWTITFNKGSYTVTDKGTVVIHGKYLIKGNKITFRDKSGRDACPGPGTYSFAVTGNTANFTKVSDSNPNCVGRVAVVSGTFTKVG